MELLLSKATFGLMSSLFVLIGGLPYLRDIHKRRAHPHVLSWIGWAFFTAIGASAMLAQGSMWAVTILFANTALCLIITSYSIITRTGVWSTGAQDIAFFGVGLLGLVLWLTLDMPLMALICAILADFCFGVPTIIKTYKNPASETPFVWTTATISGLLSLFALQSLSFHEVAYPLYLFLFDIVVLALALGIITRTKRRAPRTQAVRRRR